MTPSLREAVRRRAEERCEYCHLPASCSILPFEIDHIIPEKHGGPTDLENLALACCYCNRFKGPNLSGVDNESGRIVRLFHPRRDRWGEHFVWQATSLKALSPIGRVTVQVLGLNSPGHLRVRGSLADEGIFPFV
jgi:hypothetical protein